MTTEPYRERQAIENLNKLGVEDVSDQERRDTVMEYVVIELAAIGDSLEHWRSMALKGEEYPEFPESMDVGL